MLHDLFPAAALTLVDPSPGMLERARDRVPGAEVVAADAASFLRADDREWDSHEPLLDDGSVQAAPVSVVSGDQRVRRHPREHVEAGAASYGLERIASDDGVAFERSEGGGPAVNELVVGRSAHPHASVAGGT